MDGLHVVNVLVATLSDTIDHGFDKQVHECHAVLLAHLHFLRRLVLLAWSLQVSHRVLSEQPLSPQDVPLVLVHLSHQRLHLHVVDLPAGTNDVVVPRRQQSTINVQQHRDGTLADVQQRQRRKEVVADEDAEEDVVVDDALQVVAHPHLRNHGMHLQVQVLAQCRDANHLQWTVVETVILSACTELLAGKLRALTRAA